MAKKIAEYEIPGDGDCSKCETIYLGNLVHDCLPFYNKDNTAVTVDEENWTQLQQCKDFLKVKTFCVDCKHFTYNYDCSECDLGNKNICSDAFCPDDWYFINCKQKEQV